MFKISYFPSTKITQPTTIELGDFLRIDSHIEIVQAIRAEQDKDRRTELKKGLPCATISGTFSKRCIEGLLEYNGLLCLDFDEADNPGQTPEDMKATLAQFDEIFYAATSVGGKGVFALVKTNNTDAANHPRLCDFMRTAFLGAGLFADPSCKDVSRLRFASYDPDAHNNPGAGTFDAQKYIAKLIEAEHAKAKSTGPVTTGTERTRGAVEAYLRAQAERKIDITTPYNDWLRVGFAFVSEFGASGESYFQQASQFHPDYNYEKTAKKYASMLKSGPKAFIGTFFKVCQEHGINFKK